MMLTSCLDVGDDDADDDADDDDADVATSGMMGTPSVWGKVDAFYKQLKQIQREKIFYRNVH